jgi:hypothetical protein
MAPLSVRWQSPGGGPEKTGLKLVFSQALNHFLPAVVVLISAVAAGGLAGPVAAASPDAAGTDQEQATIAAVAAENQYANVISQIGGRYVRVTAIMSNPNTDPHEFEASASVAVQVSRHRGKLDQRAQGQGLPL